LVFYDYFQWLDNPIDKLLYRMYLWFFLGAMFNWQIYPVVPVIVVHYYFTKYKKKKNPVKLFYYFPIIAIATFAVFLAHIYFIHGSLDFLYQKFIERVGINPAIHFTLLDFMKALYNRFLFLYPSVICILSLCWLVSYLIRQILRKTGVGDMILLMFLATPVLYTIAVNEQVYIHDFMIFGFAPFLAISSAVFLEWVIKKVPVRLKLFNYIIVSFVVGLAFYQGQKTINWRHQVLTSRIEPLEAIRETGKILRNDEKVVFVYSGWGDSFQYPMQAGFYLKQKCCTFAVKLEDLIQYSLNPQYRYALLRKDTAPQEIKNFLLSNFSVKEFKSYYIADLRKHTRQLSVIKTHPINVSLLWRYLTSYDYAPYLSEEINDPSYAEATYVENGIIPKNRPKMSSEGLTIKYFPNATWSGESKLVSSIEAVDLKWFLSEEQPNFTLPPGIATKPFGEIPFSATIAGYLLIPQAGDYTLGIESDNGGYLYLDNALIIENRGPGPEGLTHIERKTIRMIKGPHLLLIKFVDFGAAASIKLTWIHNGKEEVIPKGFFRAAQKYSKHD